MLGKQNQLAWLAIIAGKFVNDIQMFVKRLNKIYAPPIIEIANKQQRFYKDHQNQTVSIIPSNLSKQYDDSRFDKQLKVFYIEVDPHGRFMCFYSQIHDEIYIVSILTLLEHIENYRKNFAIQQKYSFKTSLKPEVIIKNPRASLNISQIKFSYSVQNTQFLIVTYYSGLIDLYSVASGKKIDTINLLEHHISTNKELIKSPLFNVNVFSHSLFISTYDGKLYCYEGKQLTPCLKYQDQWVRIGYDYVPQQQKSQSEQQIQFEENNKQTNKINTKKNKKIKVPIYFNLKGDLVLGQKKIQQGILTNKRAQKILNQIKQIKISKNQQQENIINESYAEYIRLQFQKTSSQGFQMQYSMSLCERFIICKHSTSKNLAYQYKRSVYYTIRSKENKWQYLTRIRFYSYPSINHFWGIKFRDKSKQQVKQNKFINYCLKDEKIVIAVIGNYQNQEHQRQKSQSKQRSQKIQTKVNNITNQNTISIIRVNRKPRRIEFETVCKLTDAKHAITKINWVGPNNLLYLDETGNIYYMEIRPEILMT